MSAFVVSSAHVDLLVKVAIEGPVDAEDHPSSSFPLRHVDERTGRDLARWDGGDGLDPSELGRRWLTENGRSYAHRYREDERGEADYSYRDPGYRLTAAEALRAIDCLECQSCEHPGWKESAARYALHRLRDAIIERIPGITGTPWAWDARTIAKARAAQASTARTAWRVELEIRPGGVLHFADEEQAIRFADAAPENAMVKWTYVSAETYVLDPAVGELAIAAEPNDAAYRTGGTER